MTAIVQDEYGPDPEAVLRLGRIDSPTIGADEVLVRVHTASVDRGTWHVMAGLPYPIRLAGFGFRKPNYANPGRSLAGAIEAIGTDVGGFNPGRRRVRRRRRVIRGVRSRGREKLAPKPVNLSFEQAAAVPISGCTALQAVRARPGFSAGQTC